MGQRLVILRHGNAWVLLDDSVPGSRVASRGITVGALREVGPLALIFPASGILVTPFLTQRQQRYQPQRGGIWA